MWQDMPVSLRFPFVFAFAMAVLVAMTSIATPAYAPGVNALVPISLCFITVGMLCNAITQQNRRIVELERRLIELEANRNAESNEIAKEIS
jgi:hypothetical protein